MEVVLEHIDTKVSKIDLMKILYLLLTHPHQIHFEILSDLGIVGYFLILLNIIKLLFKQRKIKLDEIRYGSILFVIAYLTPIIPSGSFFLNILCYNFLD